ncbi:MAG TPA: GGDEF domain-containing protein, partial [Bacillus sp. (in: Bacteria)]|nr:GGDEF domain-containing protein [Bacillus sp. (in: firmicutes)]
SFIFPIIDLLLLLLGVTLIFRPAIFNAKSKLFIFILVLTGLAITDYLYFYLQGDLSERSVIFLRCLYRVFLLFIAIAATIPKNTSSKRNYFIINPTFGEKLLGIFPYLAVAVLIGFTLKEQTSSATLITGNCIAFVFVLIRHTIVRMQNKELTKTLKVFNNQLEQT